MKTATFRLSAIRMLALMLATLLILALPRLAHAAVEIAEDGTCLVSGQDAYGAYMPPGYAVNPCDTERIVMTCVVSGIDAYAHYMPPGYGVKTCVPGAAPTPEIIRRAACPEMWSTVKNISGDHCRGPNDRRNETHDPIAVDPWFDM